jgi:hypothetical protein
MATGGIPPGYGATKEWLLLAAASVQQVVQSALSGITRMKKPVGVPEAKGQGAVLVGSFTTP